MVTFQIGRRIDWIVMGRVGEGFEEVATSEHIYISGQFITTVLRRLVTPNGGEK